MKKKFYQVVCLVSEVEVYRDFISAKDDDDAVSIMQDKFPDLRSDAARIYLNGITVPRHKMGQTMF